jgi:hypothetical protein
MKGEMARLLVCKHLRKHLGHDFCKPNAEYIASLYLSSLCLPDKKGTKRLGAEPDLGRGKARKQVVQPLPLRQGKDRFEGFRFGARITHAY